MNTIIVDDEAVSREALKHCVEQIKELDLVAECKNALEATQAINNHKVDLVFLDIEMPDMDGIDLVKNFEMPNVVFVTSKPEFAADAFNLNAIDFITKPVELPRLLMAVEKVKKARKSDIENEAFVFIKHDSRYVKLNLGEIRYVEALADYVNIYVGNNKRYTILSTMKSLESRLPNEHFVRVHRSYIIRLDKIEEIEDNTITIDNKAIPISRSYRENIMKRLKML